MTNQVVLQSLLAKYGIKVDKAKNGLEALAALRAHSGYDLVFKALGKRVSLYLVMIRK